MATVVLVLEELLARQRHALDLEDPGTATEVDRLDATFTAGSRGVYVRRAARVELLDDAVALARKRIASTLVLQARPI